MDRDMWERVLGYVDSHIQEKLFDVDLLKLQVTTFYFSRLFAEVMGMPCNRCYIFDPKASAYSILLNGKKVLEYGAAVCV